jgi:hypothetical protein
LSPAIKFFSGVVVTCDKFITGVATRQGLIAGVIDTGEQLIACFFDAGDKHTFANISTNVVKKFETASILRGLGDTDS